MTFFIAINGLAHFSQDTRFLWMAGYMISVFPYLFYDGNNDVLLPEWESKAGEMLALSYKQNPNDLITKIMYFGVDPVSVINNFKEYKEYIESKTHKEYLEARTNLTPFLNDCFTDITAIERY